MAFVTLVTWAGYFAASKRARQTLGTLEYLTALLLIATVAVAPVAILFGGGLGVERETWVVIVVLALGSGAVGHFLMNWSHGHIPLHLSSLLTLSLPAVSAVSAAALARRAVGRAADPRHRGRGGRAGDRRHPDRGRGRVRCSSPAWPMTMR